jgi:hypothetical protein
MRTHLAAFTVGLALVIPTSAVAHAEQETSPVTTATSAPTLTSRADPCSLAGRFTYSTLLSTPRAAS